MRFLPLTTIALASSYISPSFAAPTQEDALVERQGPADAPAALAMIQQLYTDVKQYTAVINSTAASMSRNNKRENRADSTKTFRTNIASINKLVVKTTSNIKKLGKRDLESPTALAERQLPPPDPAAALAAALAMLLMEIGGALNMVIAALGLSATLALLGPLVESLSMLITSLLPVVTNLLALLGALLNGVLGGLSLPLAGLLF